MTTEALRLSRKKRHLKESYDFKLSENKSYETKWIAKDENGEWKLGKIIRIESGEKLPLQQYKSKFPTTLIFKEGDWAFIGIDRNGEILERYSAPTFKDEDEVFRDSDKISNISTESINLEEGMIYTIFAHSHDSRVSVFRYSDPELAEPLIEQVYTKNPQPQKYEDFRKFTNLVGLIENFNAK